MKRTLIGSYSRIISSALFVIVFIYFSYSMVNIYTKLCDKFYRNILTDSIVIDEELNTRVKSISYITKNEFKPQIEKELSKENYSGINELLQKFKKTFTLTSDIHELFVYDKNYNLRESSVTKNIESYSTEASKYSEAVKKLLAKSDDAHYFRIMRSHVDPNKWVLPIIISLSNKKGEFIGCLVVSVNLTSLTNVIKLSDQLSLVKTIYFSGQEEFVNAVDIESFANNACKQIITKVLLDCEKETVNLKFKSKATNEDIILVYNRRDLATELEKRLFSSLIINLSIVIIIFIIYKLYKKHVLEKIILLHEKFESLQNRFHLIEGADSEAGSIILSYKDELGDVNRIATIGTNFIRKLEELTTRLDKKNNAIQKIAIQGSLALSNLRTGSELLVESQKDLISDMTESRTPCKNCNVANHLIELTKTGQLNTQTIETYNEIMLNSIKWLLQSKTKLKLSSLIEEIIYEEHINPKELEICESIHKLRELLVLPDAFKETIRICILYYIEQITYDSTIKISAHVNNDNNLILNFTLDKPVKIDNDSKLIFEKIKMYAIINNSLFNVALDSEKQTISLHFMGA